MRKQYHILAISLCILFLVSCAPSKEEALRNGLREARFHLSNNDCGKAQDVLDDLSADDSNADFVSVKASSIACDAGYTDIDIVSNLLMIDIANPENTLGSLSTFSTVIETSADQVSYTKLLEAINYLINAEGETNPSTQNRVNYYGAQDGNDLSMQALIMTLSALGKYIGYYANTDTSGVKGGGRATTTATNGCIAFYPFDASVNAYIASDDGGPNIMRSCNNSSDGHLDLDPGAIAPAIVKRRLCEGIILFNNLSDILSNITLSSSDELGNLGGVASILSDVYDAAILLEGAVPFGATAITDLRNIRSQSQCELESDDDIQRFFVILFEHAI